MDIVAHVAQIKEEVAKKTAIEKELKEMQALARSIHVSSDQRLVIKKEITRLKKELGLKSDFKMPSQPRC